MNIKVPAVEKEMFSTALEVRISDINYGRHLGHDALVSYFHEARVQFFKKLGYSELDIEGLGVLLTSLVVNYVSEVFYADKLLLTLEMRPLGKTSLEVFYQAFHQDSHKEVARAMTQLTFFDYQKSKIAKIPRPFLSALLES